MKIKSGFTMIELVLVIAVMAILATLSVVGIIKANQEKDKAAIKATCVTLQSALVNYRASENRWPVALEPQGDSKIITFREDNAKVFAPLLAHAHKTYLDVSALFTKIPGKGVLPLRKALELKVPPETASLGYPDPEKRSNFVFFKVTFNIELETVRVEQ